MRIYATLNERTVRRTFRERKFGRTGLTVIDNDLPAFALKISKNGRKKYIVRVANKLGRNTVVLGTTDEITVEQAREKAAAAVAAVPAPCCRTPRPGRRRSSCRRPRERF